MTKEAKMFIRIDLQSDTPIYIQLRNQIIKGIATRKLKENESLPSVRQLAEDLGINLHTVNKAYNILKQEGFIKLNRRKGAIVNLKKEIKSDSNKLVNLQKILEPIVAEYYCKNVTKEEFIKIINKIWKDIENGGLK